jgi:hypothetical protein
MWNPQVGSPRDLGARQGGSDVVWKRDDYYQNKDYNVSSIKYKTSSTTKTQSNIRKTNKFCTNYGMIYHNVETCRKKEHTIGTIIETIQPSQKPHKTSSYECHIYGLNGHKMIDCPKFIEMQKMF